MGTVNPGKGNNSRVAGLEGATTKGLEAPKRAVTSGPLSRLLHNGLLLFL
jgi:hypothetical protein